MSSCGGSGERRTQVGRIALVRYYLPKCRTRVDNVCVAGFGTLAHCSLPTLEVGLIGIELPSKNGTLRTGEPLHPYNQLN